MTDRCHDEEALMSALRAATLAVGGILLGLLAASGSAQAQQDIAGTYCLSGVREVGSCFRFSADHTFEYFLSYGAYDEQSEGRWRLDGDDVVLESAPYDRKPNFAFKERFKFQFRAEFFNAFNHPVLGNPNTAFTNGNFGRILSTQTAPRVGELGLKLSF